MPTLSTEQATFEVIFPEIDTTKHSITTEVRSISKYSSFDISLHSYSMWLTMSLLHTFSNIHSDTVDGIYHALDGFDQWYN